MFAVRISYVAVLQQVAYCCSLPYISGIHEILQDGASLYGIEVELPGLCCRFNSRTLFFWASSGMERSAAYEAAALQALLVLQDIFGFVILDYSVHGLILYRSLAQSLLPVANRGVQLARFVINSSLEGVSYDPSLLSLAQQL
ncbi:hypothetical protein BDA96_10G217900, partial [Sorghum bicolor]